MTSKTIRKTMLDIIVDPKSRRQLEALIKQLERLNKERNQAVANINKVNEGLNPAFDPSKRASKKNQRFIGGAANASQVTGESKLPLLNQFNRQLSVFDRSMASVTNQVNRMTVGLSESAQKEMKTLTRGYLRELTGQGAPINRGVKAKVSEQDRAKINAARASEQASARRNLDGGASLFKQQALLLRNYAVLGTSVGVIAQSANFTVQLEKEMKQLQSIVALTNNEMSELSGTLIDISEKTKFTALEVTQAAVVLGQAGLGKEQIADSIEGITLFATAVGADLKQAVDLATSTIGIFNRDAADMVNISDKLTTAVNSSKLNLDKLALGLQYAGNIASQSNVSFEETVAALGAMANSGIRSGSTLGTGLRQVLIALQKPSDQFRTTVEALGIDMSELDVSTQGLIPVLKRLAQGGFTVTDAMRTMQVRAAAAFGAFANNIDVADELAEKMTVGGAAARANSVQMEAFANQWARLVSTFNSLIAQTFDPMLKSLTSIVEKMATFLSSARELVPVLQTIGTVLAGIGIGAAIGGIGKLVGGLAFSGAAVARILADADGGAGKPSSSSKARNKMAGATLSRIGKVVTVLGSILTRLTIVGAVLGGIFGLVSYFVGRARTENQLKDRLDKKQAEVNDVTSDVDATESRLKKLNEIRARLVGKQDLLVESAQGDKRFFDKIVAELNEELKAYNIYINRQVDTYAELQQSLKDARTDSETRNTSKKILKGAKSLELAELSQESFFGENGVTAFANASRNLRGRQRTSRLTGAFGSTGGASASVFEEIEAQQGGSLETFLKQYREINKLITAFGSLDLSNANAVELSEIFLDGFKDYAAEITKTLKDSSSQEAFAEELGIPLKEFKEASNNYLETLNNSLNEASNFVANVNVSDKNRAENLQNEANINTFLEENLRPGLEGQLADVKRQVSEVVKRTSGQRNTDRNAFEGFRELVEVAQQANDRFDAEREAFNNLIEGQDFNSRDVADVRREKGFEAISENLFKTINEAVFRFVERDATAITARIQSLVSQKTSEAQSLEKLFSESDDQGDRDALRKEILTLFEGTGGTGENDLGIAELNELLKQLQSVQNKDGTQNFANFAREREQSVLSKREDLDRVEQKLSFDNQLTRQLADRDLNLRVQDREYDAFIGSKLFQEDFARTQSDIDEFRNTQQQVLEALDRRAQLLSTQLEDTLGVANSDDFTQETRQQALEQAQELTRQLTNTRTRRIEEEAALNDEILRLTQEYLDYLNELVANNPKLKSGIDGARVAKIIQTLETQLAKGELEGKKIDGKRTDTRLENVDTQADTEIAGRDLKANQFDDSLRRRLFGAINGESFTPVGQNENDDTYADRNPTTYLEKVKGGLIGVRDVLNEAMENFDPMTEAMVGLSELSLGLAGNFASAFKEFATGTKSASDAFKSFTIGILESMLDIAAQILANQILKTVLGAFAGGLAGGAGGAGGAGAGGAQAAGGTFYTGGEVFAGSYAGGGEIKRGTITRDSALANVSKGEFVLRRKAVQALGIDTVKALNSADPNVMQRQQNRLAGTDTQVKDSEGQKIVNVWMVTPDQAPEGLSENDVVSVVSDNIKRGGSIKKLVKSVNMGTL